MERLNDAVHVWYLDPDADTDEALAARCLQRLSAAEQARYRRFHFPADAHRYLLSHALLRGVLAGYTAGLDATQLLFRATARGKPVLENRGFTHLKFNLTHTPGLAACVISRDGACGIDAEKVVARHNPVGVAARLFSAPEYAALQCLQGAEQLDYFYTRWTLREAYVKALGSGLAFPLRALHFSLDGDANVAVRFEAPIDDRSDNWEIKLWRPGPEHVAALFVARRAGTRKQVLIRRFEL